MTNYEEVRTAIDDAVHVYRKELNIYRYIPRTLVPPCAVIKPRGNRTIDYMKMQGRSTLADWYFTVMIIIGRIDERAAQKQAGEMISPGSQLIRCLQAMKLPTGFCQVTEGAVNDLMFGQALYTYAELQLKITA